ncbi:MKRN2 opposite strand protein [Hylaeus anthracinus]|uniref:MKRN2 opposite strand protein n=1 Tax=Hylaeus volcanicus TaxID=313075 RepID=UPI0023B77ABD|nr:MKRN2 opposite strand protein [Hylaeus volcanicus]XP_054007133.1 MKRN2 opposite strand protein [Hylaeus anthracinus]
MSRDPGILCFRHCCNKSIFCKSVPKICPICQSSIANYNTEPFLIPYPYTNAIYQPAAVVVRPSQGNFLNEYSILNDLHIGITNSQGIVHEYDKQGIIINDHSKWTDCIALKITPICWDYHWDETLQAILKDNKWRSDNYDEVTMNCFNFVIEFINNLQYMNMIFISKENMCDKLILAKIQEAVKYNSVFKSLEHNDYFIT